jgi:aldehyde dehydrogenase (NAD+)
MPYGDVLASEIAEKDAYMRRKPWGVAAVITPWNFPFAVPLWMLGPSLLEGNTVVFKPSEDTPLVGQRLVELFLEAGFPAGVLNLVHGAAEAGEALVGNPDVNIALFTGSYEVGKRIREVSTQFADRIVATETGSKSAVIICDDAKLDLAVTAAVVGDPLDSGNFTGPVIHRDSVEKVLRYNALAKQEGVQVLLEGGPITSGEHGKGCYLSPFVYRTEAKAGVRTIREEVFGPHVAVIPFRDNEDAIRIYNDTPFGLSMAVITESYRNMRLFRDECEYGMGYVNLPCIGAEVHLPFGGVKRSGNGHPSAAGLIETVTHKTAWTVNHGTEIKMAQGLTIE